MGIVHGLGFSGRHYFLVSCARIGSCVEHLRVNKDQGGRGKRMGGQGQEDKEEKWMRPSNNDKDGRRPGRAVETRTVRNMRTGSRDVGGWQARADGDKDSRGQGRPGRGGGRDKDGRRTRADYKGGKGRREQGQARALC